MASPAKFATLLTHLAQVTVDIPDAVFNMDVWGMKNDDRMMVCVAGAAALDPWFKKRGIKSEWGKDPDVWSNYNYYLKIGTPSCVNLGHFKKVFDLDEDQGDLLYHLMGDFDQGTKKEALGIISNAMKTTGYQLVWS